MLIQTCTTVEEAREELQKKFAEIGDTSEVYVTGIVNTENGVCVQVTDMNEDEELCWIAAPTEAEVWKMVKELDLQIAEDAFQE